MSQRKQDRSSVIVRSIVESKRGSVLLVERVQLTPAGTRALTSTSSGINSSPQEVVSRITRVEPTKPEPA